MSNGASKNLVIMVADKDIRVVLEKLIGERHTDMGIRGVNFDILPGTVRDSDCRTRAHDILREHCGNYKHALVVFDLKGSGGKDRSGVERFVERKLVPNGWPDDRAAAVVIDPELEAWIWCSQSNLRYVQQILGIRSQENFAKLETEACEGPKKAFKKACRQAKKRSNYKLYRELAEKLPVRSCQDPAFQKLLTTLRRWFP